MGRHEEEQRVCHQMPGQCPKSFRKRNGARLDKTYAFDAPGGNVSLLDLFEGRTQLLLYHFMFAPGVDGWPSAGCPGCSMFVDNIGQFTLIHLRARDVSFAAVSRAPLANIQAYQQRMGWTVPWVSSAGNTGRHPQRQSAP